MIILFARIFTPLENHLSRLMIISATVTIPIVFILEVFNISALMILKVMHVRRLMLSSSRRQRISCYACTGRESDLAWASSSLDCASFLSGWRSFGHVWAPRIIGILLIIGGVGYVADCCISILLQRTDYLTVRSYLIFTHGGLCPGPAVDSDQRHD